MASVEVREDLVQKAIGWIIANQDQFAIPEDANEPTVLTLLKPLGELALTCDILIRYGIQPVSIAGREIKWESILSFCWSQVRDGEKLFKLLQRYPDYFAFVAMYPAFYLHEFRNESLERLIAHMANLRGIRSLEFPPWRALDLSLAMQVLGLDSPWRSNDLFEKTWLYSKPEPWLLSEGTAYSVTHTVFYMTDFGFDQSGLPQVHRDYLQKWLPVWCQYYSDIRNMDLLGEMLMVTRCIGASSCPLYWDVLHRAQHDDGLVPGPVEGPEIDPAKMNPSRLRFLNHYHTTLVAVLAGIMSA